MGAEPTWTEWAYAYYETAKTFLCGPYDESVTKQPPGNIAKAPPEQLQTTCVSCGGQRVTAP